MNGPTELNAAILTALAPRGLSERLRWRISGGLTVRQVFERLPDGVRGALISDVPNRTLAERDGVERVESALSSLVDSGAVERERVRLRVELEGKGKRLVYIDAYRAVSP